MHTQNDRSFHRSEAFPEDVADLVESATVIAATRRGQHAHRQWLSMLPLGATALAALGAALVLLQRIL
jgi:hypothetical protein